MLRLRKIDKVYGNDEHQTKALNAVSIDIAAAEFVAVMGPSGCGKSSLLNIIGLLDNATGGQYFFQGQDITQQSQQQLSKIRKHHIGFIFQDFNLIDELSVSENIELALLYHKISAKERRLKVANAMDKVGIAHRAQHLPHQLSGGQQQMVAIARAVVGEQALILADEPTGNLDSIHGQQVMKLLQDLNQQGTTIVMVTHSLAHADYARRTINLFDGGVVTQSLRAVC